MEVKPSLHVLLLTFSILLFSGCTTKNIESHTNNSTTVLSSTANQQSITDSSMLQTTESSSLNWHPGDKKKLTETPIINSELIGDWMISPKSESSTKLLRVLISQSTQKENTFNFLFLGDYNGDKYEKEITIDKPIKNDEEIELTQSGGINQNRIITLKKINDTLIIKIGESDYTLIKDSDDFFRKITLEPYKGEWKSFDDGKVKLTISNTELIENEKIVYYIMKGSEDNSNNRLILTTLDTHGYEYQFYLTLDFEGGNRTIEYYRNHGNEKVYKYYSEN